MHTFFGSQRRFIKALPVELLGLDPLKPQASAKLARWQRTKEHREWERKPVTKQLCLPLFQFIWTLYKQETVCGRWWGRFLFDNFLNRNQNELVPRTTQLIEVDRASSPFSSTASKSALFFFYKWIKFSPWGQRDEVLSLCSAAELQLSNNSSLRPFSETFCKVKLTAVKSSFIQPVSRWLSGENTHGGARQHRQFQVIGKPAVCVSLSLWRNTPVLFLLSTTKSKWAYVWNQYFNAQKTFSHNIMTHMTHMSLILHRDDGWTFTFHPMSSSGQNSSFSHTSKANHSFKGTINIQLCHWHSSECCCCFSIKQFTWL